MVDRDYATSRENELREYRSGTSGKPVSPNIKMSAWIDTNGGFYDVPNYSHDLFARAWFNCSGDELQARGFVHLTQGALYFDHEITQKQLDTLFDIQMMLQAAILFSSIERYQSERFNESMNGIQYAV